MSATRSEVLDAAKAACLNMVRTQKSFLGSPVEDYEEVLEKMIKVITETKNIRPAVWAVVLGGLGEIIKARYGKKDW
jgi:hypothetical protein